jgi:hypothetical protein
MATPNVTVDIADFVTGVAPASKGGYGVTLTEDVDPGELPGATLYRQAYTNSSGVATLASVTPGDYLLQIFGLGVDGRVITIPNEAGPIDAADLTAGDSVTSAVPSEGNPLLAGTNITLTQKPTGLEIASSGGGGEGTGFTDTDGALSIESDVAATAVGISFDNTTELTEGSIVEFKNAGDRQSGISPFGGLVFLSANAKENGPGPSVAGELVNAFFEVDEGEPTTAKMYAEVVNNTTEWDEGASFSIDATKATPNDNSAARLSLASYTTGSPVWTIAASSSDPGFSYLKFTASSTARTDFSPMVADSGSAVAYLFDTANALSNAGARLLSVKTNGSEKAAILASGRLLLVSAPPANASDAGVAGSISWDSGFIYVCTATNTWKRVAIATW